jgi:hypothetical protein
MTTVDGADIHSNPARSMNSDTVPVVLAHGWSASIMNG